MACPDETTQAESLAEVQIEDSVTCLINVERTAAGLKPVRPNAKLQSAAASHSSEMVSNGYFAHTSPAGLSFVDRIETAGYMRGARLWTVGENLVWGTGPLSTPQSMVDAWMQSPPHRENLLRGRFREVGVSAARGTPDDASELNGVIVSSEYGFRIRGRGAQASRSRQR
jgi:uncharacterized protein YkwD